MKAKFNRNNYIHIPGWAITDLKLKGNELLVYSVIHGFSQDNTSYFTGSISYLEEALNASRNTIIKTLKKLTEDNLIIREEVPMNGLLFVKYKHNMSKTALLVQNEEKGSAEIEKGSAVSDKGSAETAPNNTINNTNNNKEDIYTNSDFKKDLIDYGFKKELVNDWLVIRKSKGGVNTRVALNGFIKQIELHGGDKNELMEEIVSKSWAGFNINWGVETKGKNNPQSKPTQSNAGKSFYELAMEDYEKFKDNR